MAALPSLFGRARKLYNVLPMLKSKGKTLCMVEEPSHVKQVSPKPRV
jgi:hypothetical protein